MVSNESNDSLDSNAQCDTSVAFSENNIPQNEPKVKNDLNPTIDNDKNNSYNNLIESGDYNGKYDNRRTKGTDTNISEGRNTSNINQKIERGNEQIERGSTDRFRSENTLSKNQNEQGTYRVEEENIEGRDIKRVRITDEKVNDKIIYDIDEDIKKQRVNGQWLPLPNSNNSLTNDNIQQNDQKVNCSCGNSTIENDSTPTAHNENVGRVESFSTNNIPQNQKNVYCSCG